jgi:hypothetical protein
LLDRAREVGQAARGLLKEEETAGTADYRDTYEHFKSDFLAQIFRECKILKTT